MARLMAGLVAVAVRGRPLGAVRAPPHGPAHRLVRRLVFRARPEPTARAVHAHEDHHDYHQHDDDELDGAGEVVSRPTDHQRDTGHVYPAPTRTLRVADATVSRYISGCCDPSQDEVDAGQELLAVVVPGQLPRHPAEERVLGLVELRPLRGDGREER